MPAYDGPAAMQTIVTKLLENISKTLTLSNYVEKNEKNIIKDEENKKIIQEAFQEDSENLGINVVVMQTIRYGSHPLPMPTVYNEEAWRACLSPDRRGPGLPNSALGNYFHSIDHGFMLLNDIFQKYERSICTIDDIDKKQHKYITDTFRKRVAPALADLIPSAELASVNALYFNNVLSLFSNFISVFFSNEIDKLIEQNKKLEKPDYNNIAEKIKSMIMENMSQGINENNPTKYSILDKKQKELIAKSDIKTKWEALINETKIEGNLFVLEDFIQHNVSEKEFDDLRAKWLTTQAYELKTLELMMNALFTTDPHSEAPCNLVSLVQQRAQEKVCLSASSDGGIRHSASRVGHVSFPRRRESSKRYKIRNMELSEGQTRYKVQAHWIPVVTGMTQ